MARYIEIDRQTDREIDCYSKLWSFGEYLEEKYTFQKDDMVEFSKLHQDKVDR